MNLAKPVLLLAVFDAIGKSVVNDNKIVYNAIKPLYEEKLSLFQDEPTPLRYPFFYLKSDGFWQLKWMSDSLRIPVAPSDKYLRENLAFAMFDNVLRDLLQNERTRDYLRDSIINHYKMTTKTK